MYLDTVIASFLGTDGSICEALNGPINIRLTLDDISNCQTSVIELGKYLGVRDCVDRIDQVL